MKLTRALTNLELFSGDVCSFVHPEILTAQPELLYLFISSYVRAVNGKTQERLVWIKVEKNSTLNVANYGIF